MGKSINVNVSGTWRTVNKPYVNVGGTWRNVQGVWVNVGGTWYKSWPNAPVWTYNLFGGSFNGGEQIAEANAIASAMSTYGVFGSYSVSSCYRNSCATFACTGTGYFMLDGTLLIGPNMTIIHHSNFIGILNHSNGSCPVYIGSNINNETSNSFTIDDFTGGSYATKLNYPGATFTVTGSTNNNGTWTVSGSGAIFDGYSSTTVGVTGTVNTSVTDGQINTITSYPSPCNGCQNICTDYLTSWGRYNRTLQLWTS